MHLTKKVFVLIALITASSSAFAVKGFLESEWTEGQWKYCKYSNGKIITIKAYKICPLNID